MVGRRMVGRMNGRMDGLKPKKASSSIKPLLIT